VQRTSFWDGTKYPLGTVPTAIPAFPEGVPFSKPLQIENLGIRLFGQFLKRTLFLVEALLSVPQS
jgi:hypothetical protein